MCSPGELIDKMKTTYYLIKEHNHNLDSLDNLVPFEFEVYVMMAIEHNETAKKNRGVR